MKRFPPLRKIAAVAVVAVLGLAPRAPAASGISLAPAKAAQDAPPGEAAALARIVGRLAGRENRSARDWAELGRETVTWGSRLQSQQQPVPDGPIHDALAAVDLGAKLDKAATDWPKLRQELEALLKEPEREKEQDQQQKQQQQQQNQQDKNNPQQNQDKQKQDQQQSDQQKQQSDSQQKNEHEKNQQQGDQPEQQQDKKPPGESAFGDMTQKNEPPPPPPQNTQKVGGTPDKKAERREPLDPALALPTQKLEQLKNQDSPAQLFQLMDGEKKPAKKTGKDW